MHTLTYTQERGGRREKEKRKRIGKRKPNLRERKERYNER